VSQQDIATLVIFGMSAIPVAATLVWKKRKSININWSAVLGLAVAGGFCYVVIHFVVKYW
jgi:hypothetical protein